MTATEKQIGFMKRLADERQMDFDLGVRLAGLVDAHEAGDEFISKEKASEIIEWLLKLPGRDGAAVAVSTDLDLGGLDEGRYAIGDVLFLVQKPKDGNWAGWVFVKNGSQYADERYGSQKPGGSYQGINADLLSSILADPTEAMKHYGIITGHCGVCGRPLEDEVSVARGIGPICFGRLA
jgi:hypothetical protein